MLLDFSSSISQYFSILCFQSHFQIVHFSLHKCKCFRVFLGTGSGCPCPLYSVSYCFECHLYVACSLDPSQSSKLSNPIQLVQLAILWASHRELRQNGTLDLHPQPGPHFSKRHPQMAHAESWGHIHNTSFLTCSPVCHQILLILLPKNAKLSISPHLHVNPTHCHLTVNVIGSQQILHLQFLLHSIIRQLFKTEI